MADSTSRESGVNISVDESHVAPAPDRSLLASPEDGDLIVQGLTQDLEDVNTTPLHYAAYSGVEEDLIQVLAMDGITQDHIDQHDGNGRTPLIYSVIGDAARCVAILLEANANINLPDSDGRTPLHWAAHQNNYKMIKFLVQRGAISDLRDTAERTPLHLATAAQSSKGVRMLLKVVPLDMINLADVDGMTALHWCAAHDHPKHLDALIGAGADTRATDNELKTPLHWCSGHSETLTASLLLHADLGLVQERDMEGRTTLHLALSEQNMPLTGMLLESMTPDQLAIEDNMRRTALHWAAVLGIADAVSVLVQYGLDPLAQDDVGATSLHYSAQNESGACVAALLDAIGSAADVIPDQEGRTPLMWASSQGNTEAMVLLTTAGGDIHARDNSGGSALHVAAYSGKIDSINLLLDMESSIDALDNQNHSALFRACEMGHVDAVQTLLDRGASTSLIDAEGRTPLHWAALGGSDSICLQLLERQVQVNQVDTEGRNALQCAAFMGYPTCMFVLVEHNADVDARDSEGVSALHWAASSGQLEAVRLLIEAGASHSPREIDRDQFTPLDYARIGDPETGQPHEDIIEYLEAQGALSIDVIKDAAAAVIQREWRHSKVHSKATAAPKKPTDIAHVKQSAPNALAQNQSPQIKKKSPKVKKKVVAPKPPPAQPKQPVEIKTAEDATKSILEKERLRREKRARERKEREEARLREQEAREKAEKELAERRQEIILKAAQVREQALKERKRIELIREKQKAAQVIQENWKERNEPLPKAASSERKEPRRAPRPKPKPASEALQFHKLTDRFDPTPEWKRTIAALTIQLHWRQYARRKALERAARRKKVLNSWDPSAIVKTQSRRVSSIYGQPLVMQQYKPAASVSMRRPKDNQSPFVSSYSFALSKYSIRHTRNSGGLMAV